MNEAAPNVSELAALRVLLVEDDPAVAKLLRMMLAAMQIGFVHAAKDGVEALHYLDAHEGEVNTVICDWNMPNMTGIGLLRQVRAVDPDMHFIMITGQATAEYVTQARALNVSAFIAKPFDAAVLREKLQVTARLLAMQSSLSSLRSP